MSIIVQRHVDARMSHDILYCFLLALFIATAISTSVMLKKSTATRHASISSLRNVRLQYALNSHRICHSSRAGFMFSPPPIRGSVVKKRRLFSFAVVRQYMELFILRFSFPPYILGWNNKEQLMLMRVKCLPRCQ